MSDFAPPPHVLNKWTYTRKAKRKLGDSFIHPRLFSTVDSKTDATLFWIAFTIEIAIGIMAMSMRGFAWIVVGIVSALFIVDLIFAWLLHQKKQNDICKENCEIEILKYRKKFNLFEGDEDENKINALRDGIAKLRKRQKKYKAGIIISAVIKIFGFWLINYYGIAIFVFVAVLYAFAGYIHIVHTGYYFFFVRFIISYKKAKGAFLKKVLNGELDEDIIHVNDPITNIPPEIRAELINSVDAVLKKKPTLDNPFVLYGKGSKKTNAILCEVDYDDSKRIKSYNFILSRYGLIEDDEWFNFINNAGMTAPVKSFFGYVGLVNQFHELDTPE